jgi:hypothetical protein
MESHLSLINIKTPTNGLKTQGNQKYSGVKATFCHLSWQLQDKNPTNVPTFQHIRDLSPLCLGTRFTVDLWEITRQAEQYDLRNHTFVATTPREGQGPHPPTAVIFHQSRCGSTLVSNILAAFRPQHSRVYAEAPAPITALLACDDVECDEEAQNALIQDVFYMMGRSPGPTLPQYVFYKFQAIGAQHIALFERAMPNTPWMFLYRDPTEVMVSLLKNVLKGGNPLGRNYLPHCLRDYGTAQHPEALTSLVESKEKRVEDLTKEEYCAAHLATLGDAALHQYQKRKASKRWLINYSDLPHAIWETVLPSIVGPLSTEQLEAMRNVAKLESRNGKVFHEDSQMKQGTATEEMKQATKLFMQPIYDSLEAVRKGIQF